MGKIKNNVNKVSSSFTQQVKATPVAVAHSKLREGIRDVRSIPGNAVVLGMAKAWIAMGVLQKANTAIDSIKNAKAVYNSKFNPAKDASGNPRIDTSPLIDRYDTDQMWGMKLGEYFLPLSQTYTAVAQKKVNVSSLVDGIDIIQQTRKSAKTIDCSLKISVNPSSTNLQFMQKEERLEQVKYLAEFLADLYETDAVFAVDNETLNETFGIDFVLMTKYKFTPKAGSRVYLFEFSLMEVKYGENVLTFDENQLQESEPITLDETEN